jgi:surface carbohydrate biosynthesis protein
LNNIYLPIEVPQRELHSRAFLSTKLASKNNKVFVFEHTYFDRIGWPGEGIYIGKNCFRSEIPHDLEYYNKMKDSNIKIWFLEEEGGIYIGNSKKSWESELVKRFDYTQLNFDDKIFFWGNWQKNFYKDKNLKSQTYITGSPNFDICQKKYLEVFKEYDLNITGGKKDYILINTRFANGNSRNGKYFGLSNSSYSDHHTKNELMGRYLENNIMIFHFIKLIRDIALKLPKELFILRPHPAESVDIYNKLLSELANVIIVNDGSSIEPWLRQCKVLVHNGCSTAIQAAVSKKRIISFLPEIQQGDFSPGLPNSIGFLAKTIDDVLTHLEEKGEKKYDNNWTDTISNLNSINYINDILSKEHYKASKDFKINIPIKEKIKDLFDITSRKILNHSFRSGLTDIDKISEFPSLVKIANKYYNSEVKCIKISEFCYLVKNK